MGFGLDDWIYCSLLYNLSQWQQLTITHNKWLRRIHSFTTGSILVSLYSNLNYDWLHSQAKSQSQSYVTTDGQSVSLSWCQAPIWDLYDQILFLSDSYGLFTWDAPSDERTRLSFTMYNVQCTMYNIYSDCILIWTASCIAYQYPRKRLLLPQRLVGFQEFISTETYLSLIS
jgi:hypothetical protein